MRNSRVVFLMCIVCVTAVFSQFSSTPRQQTWVTNGTVYAIAATDDKVYIGGDFTYVGPADKSDSTARHSLACFDAASGTATAWNPNANRYVRALSLIGSKIYVGGRFDTISGQRRRNIACVDTGKGLATGWDPSANDEVYALSVDGAKVYVGFHRDSIGGQKRRYAACVDTGTGLATNWNPGANLWVYTLAASGIDVYVGGAYTGIANTTAQYLTCIDSGTSQIKMSFNPRAPDGAIYALLLKDTNLYVGGDFWNSIGGQPRSSIACLSTATGLATAWNPNADNTVFALAISGADVFAGGDFRTIGGQTRNYIAGLDMVTGMATTWDPNANNAVYAIAVNGARVYIGGSFTAIGGAARPYFAEFGVSTGTGKVSHPEVFQNFHVAANNFSNGKGVVSYSLPGNASVSIRLYDIRGRLLSSIVNQAQTAGSHSVLLTSDELGTGLYMLRFSAGGYEQTQSIAVMR